ncbi:MAG: bifunctional DNA-formamidopyrimidine glycosylase/DNA-(apurinic or apyrimidinic site) lyase [Selenomonadaceae bacterium]|nr:bifunctional DNA-formamidopyrimidine glycosylase/DNA-(apurinic or apyrimidinic site) lyase [Selenomonadaceae bacterium]
MPEMPEVEVIRRSLEGYLRGRTIQKSEVLLPRQVKRPETAEFIKRVQGETIEEVGRRGKYLIMKLSGDTDLIVHLRMTGRLVFSPEGEVKDSHPRLIFHLDGGAKLIYGDTRTLGAVYALKPEEKEIVKGLATMGPEPLTPEFTPEYLAEIFKKRATKIKSALLNQSLIGGIGNIYADEALFLARIHPEREAKTLSSPELTKLHEAINQVIGEGLADGGTTFRDYQNADGGQGSHQEKLRVYNRKGKSCPLCGQPIEKIVVGGRGTHFCPRCQK